jgi:chaperonin GroES
MIRPLYDRVIVKRVTEESKTPSGLFIPEQAKEKPVQGDVLAVGQGRRPDNGGLIPLETKVGDRVLFGKYSGTEIEHEGEKLLVLREDEIMAIVPVSQDVSQETVAYCGPL